MTEVISGPGPMVCDGLVKRVGKGAQGVDNTNVFPSGSWKSITAMPFYSVLRPWRG